MKRLLTLSLFLSLLLAASALAGPRAVIIVVDRDTGQTLVPEGTPLPEGLIIHNDAGEALTFAHAPEERFTAARETVAKSAPPANAASVIVRERQQIGRAVPKTDSTIDIRPNVEESDVTYYINFYDGSYISVRRAVYAVLYNEYHYLVHTAGYTPENDYYDGWIYLEQSSTDHPGYNQTAYCSIGSTGGSCQTGGVAYQAGPTFSAHVTAGGNIHHRRLPICGRYGEPPCQENLSGSIEIYFP